MIRSLAVISWLYAAVLAGELQAQVQGKTSLDIAVGPAGTDSFVFATELWAVSQIELLPNHGFSLETVEKGSTEDRLRGLDNGEVEFALVRGDVSPSFARSLRAVMALWPNGVAEAGIEPTQLLAHGDVSEDVVYLLTRAVSEHAGKLIGARSTIGIGSLNEVIVGLSLPLHPGAYRYYGEVEPSLFGGPALASPWLDLAPSHAVSDYAELENDEILQLRAACRDALERDALEYFDGHYATEVCHAHGDEVMRGGSMDDSHGQGGPKLSAAEGKKTVRRSDRALGDRSLKTLGLRPTM